LEVSVRLIAEKIQPDDSVMEGVTVRPIDTEDLCATGSFREIGDVVFGKLLAQVEADHVKLGYIAHVLFVYLTSYLLFNEPPRLVSPVAPKMRSRQPIIRARPLRSHEVRHSSRHPSPFRSKDSRSMNFF